MNDLVHNALWTGRRGNTACLPLHELMRITGLSDRQVRKALRELIHGGLLKPTGRRYRGTTEFEFPKKFDSAGTIDVADDEVTSDDRSSVADTASAPIGQEADGARPTSTDEAEVVAADRRHKPLYPPDPPAAEKAHWLEYAQAYIAYTNADRERRRREAAARKADPKHDVDWLNNVLERTHSDLPVTDESRAAIRDPRQLAAEPDREETPNLELVFDADETDQIGDDTIKGPAE